MTKYIANAFSLQMLQGDCTIKVETVDGFPADCLSAVGHTDTAQVLGVECSRISILLQRGDELFVAQLQGGRLPEGSTTLPEGFNFHYYKVVIES